MKVALAIAITIWTLAAWGGRIGLLTSDEGPGAWIRIGGSLAIGLLAAATLVVPKMEVMQRPTLIVFALFTVVLWARSLIVNWTGSGSLPFKLVHTVLAAGFFVLAGWAWAVAQGTNTSDDQPVAAVDGRVHPGGDAPNQPSR